MKKSTKIHPSIIFLCFILFFIIACFAANNLSFEWYYFLLLFLILVPAYFYKKNYLILFIFVIMGFLIGIFWYRYYLFRNQEVKFNKSESVCGKVTESKEFYNKYLIKLNSNSVGNIKLKKNFFLLTFENPKVLNDLICVKGEIVKIDEKNFLSKQSKNKLTFYEIKNPQIKNTNQLKFKESIFYRIVEKLQGFTAKINSKIFKTLPDPEASFISGLLLGQKSDMPKNLKNNLSKTGTTHLIALSGFNITIIISFIMFLLKPVSRKISYLIIILAIVAFVIMTGFSASIVRAALMAGFLIIAKSFGRLTTKSIIIALSAFLISVFNPLSLRFDIGFQLSFLATIGLVYLAPLLEKSSAKYLERIPKIISETLLTTLSAQIMVLPVLILYFNSVSLISPITNLIIVPFIPALMLLGFIQVVFSAIWIKLGIVFGYLVWFFSHIVLSIINWFGSFSFSQIKVENLKWVVLVPFYFVILVNILYFNLKNKHEKQSK